MEISLSSDAHVQRSNGTPSTFLDGSEDECNLCRYLALRSYKPKRVDSSLVPDRESRATLIAVCVDCITVMFHPVSKLPASLLSSLWLRCSYARKASPEDKVPASLWVLTFTFCTLMGVTLTSHSAHSLACRYCDATRTFNIILMYIQRTKQFHQRTQVYDQILKKNEQIYALVAVCLSICPASVKFLDESCAQVRMGLRTAQTGESVSMCLRLRFFPSEHTCPCKGYPVGFPRFSGDPMENNCCAVE